MKQILLSVVMLAAALSAAAQPQKAEGLSSNQRVLGYTLTDDIDIMGAAFGQAGVYTVGAVLPQSVLKAYAGCRVVGLRIAVAMNMGRTRTFLYDVSDGFLPVVEQRQRLYEGWNNIFFNGDGYTLTGSEELFFGYDYEETADMVAAEQGGLACVGDDTEGSFYLYGNYGQGEGLYSISNAGMLCVQLIVDVSSLPQADMAITYLDTGFKYKQPGEDIELLAIFANVGRDTIDSYELTLQMDDAAPQSFSRQQALADRQSDTWQGVFRLPDDTAIGMHTLTLRLVSANGQPLPATSGKEQQVSFAVYRSSLQRNKVYMEVYTDANSPLSAMLNDAIAELQRTNSSVALVNVHRKGTALAVDEAAYLEQLYAYTYPSFTVNRAYFPGEPYVAYDMNDYLPVFGTDLSAAILGDIALQDLGSPTFASLRLSGRYDADTRQLTVDADGELLPEATAIYGELALTLLLTEDKVTGSQAVYNPLTQRTTTNRSYQHPYVLRAFATPPTGQVLSVSGSTYSSHFTTTLDARWRPENMHVVALLTKAADEVTDENLLDVDVLNAESVPLSELSAQAIGTLTADGASAASVSFGIDGRRQYGPVRGLSIVRSADGTVRKQLNR